MVLKVLTDNKGFCFSKRLLRAYTHVINGSIKSLLCFCKFFFVGIDFCDFVKLATINPFFNQITQTNYTSVLWKKVGYPSVFFVALKFWFFSLIFYWMMPFALNMKFHLWLWLAYPFHATVSFCTPWKHQKTLVFWCFQG